MASAPHNSRPHHPPHHKNNAAAMPGAAGAAGLRPPSAGAPPRTPSANSSHRSSRALVPGAKPVAFTNSEPPHVIDGPGGRIACVADVRGNLSLFNQIAAETGAQAIIHTGDFGFYDNASLERISDRTLRHLVQYSTLIDPTLRSRLLAADPPRGPAATEKGVSAAVMRQQIAQQPGSLLSEFSDLLTGKIKLQVPVFTVWGACEDVAILERFRTGEYQVHNLHVLDEATTKAIEVGGIRLRLFGLGGAVVLHKLFDNGEGAATIAGGQGTMWTTALQIGELVDTAQKTFDPTETRLLITHASPGREGLLAQLALALKADLTVSAGLHFRYGVSYNEFSVQHDAENYRNKLLHAKQAFGEIWDTVKTQVDAVIDENQRLLLNNALAVANRVAPTATATGAASEEPAWKNTWNWNLPDAAYGNLVLSVRDGRVSAEMKSQGFNFAYRRSGQPMSAVTPTASVPASTPAVAQKATRAPAPAIEKAAPTPTPAASAAAPIAIKGVAAKQQQEEGSATNGASAAASKASAPTTPAAASAKPIKEKKERKERGAAHESSASRSDLETGGGFTSGTDGRKSPTGPRKVRNPYTLYVSQLKEALPVTEDELRAYFGPAAAGIAGIKLVFDKPHRRGASSSGKEDAAAAEGARRQRPFAYVEFKDEEAMKQGLKREGEVIKGGVKPCLEQADSNKSAIAAVVSGGEGEKREREKSVGKEEAAAGGKSADEGKPKRERGGKKERLKEAAKEREAKQQQQQQKGEGEGEASATEAANGSTTASHNKNKKQRNPKEKKEKREEGKPAPATAAAAGADEKDPTTKPAAVEGEKKKEDASPAPTSAPAPAATAPATAGAGAGESA